MRFLTLPQQSMVEPSRQREENATPQRQGEVGGKLPIYFRRIPVVPTPIAECLEEFLFMVLADLEMCTGALRIDPHLALGVEREPMSAGNVLQ
jgi:hypothetical protein